MKLVYKSTCHVLGKTILYFEGREGERESPSVSLEPLSVFVALYLASQSESNW